METIFGSSPHTWGIHILALSHGNHIRFIPTYVGHTRLWRRESSSLSGSSPHTWGILVLGYLRALLSRFIPTYVGHTDSNPHKQSQSLGSSPHTWGIPQRFLSQSRRYRFIPTYVGHTLMEKLDEYAASVHPHIRGAYVVQGGVGPCQLGSSPHTWGIRVRKSLEHGLQRFIPTYVGHTSKRSGSAPAGSVHPHIRGAYTGPP